MMDNNFIKACVNENESVNGREYNNLFAAYTDQQNDLKMIKELLLKVIDFLGMLNEDGTIKNKMNVKKISSTVMGIVLNTGKVKTDFQFLDDIVPLIKKYKDL